MKVPGLIEASGGVKKVIHSCIIYPMIIALRFAPTQIAAAMVLLASQNVDSLDVSMHISA